MLRETYKPEENVAKLRQVDVLVSQGSQHLTEAQLERLIGAVNAPTRFKDFWSFRHSEIPQWSQRGHKARIVGIAIENIGGPLAF